MNDQTVSASGPVKGRLTAKNPLRLFSCMGAFALLILISPVTQAWGFGITSVTASYSGACVPIGGSVTVTTIYVATSANPIYYSYAFSNLSSGWTSSNVTWALGNCTTAGGQVSPVDSSTPATVVDVITVPSTGLPFDNVVVFASDGEDAGDPGSPCGSSDDRVAILQSNNITICNTPTVTFTPTQTNTPTPTPAQTNTPTPMVYIPLGYLPQAKYEPRYDKITPTPTPCLLPQPESLYAESSTPKNQNVSWIPVWKYDQ